VKIIDITAGNISPKEVQELREATAKEIDILRKVSGHPNVSKSGSEHQDRGGFLPHLFFKVSPGRASGLKSLGGVRPPMVLMCHRAPAQSIVCSTPAHTPAVPRLSPNQNTSEDQLLLNSICNKISKF